ncbi:MAG: hypothetical protein EBV03_13905 [Proteobacteria bacterium]|nr:hypothetical protein [Pseudomonadota bacterium]
MDQQLLSLGLDIVIAVLLCTTIVYAFILNKRLQALRADREDMENLIRKFHDATTKADSSIKGLKQSSQDLSADLQEKIIRARALRDEMTFMLERGELLANQIDGSISASRNERPGQDITGLVQKSAMESAAPDRKNKELQNLQDIFHGHSGDAESSVEKELLKALKGLR